MPMILTGINRAQLPSAARAVLQLAGETRVFLFEGNLGAGKTTLIRHLCRELGYMGDVTSPTFSIINMYPSLQEDICHMDLYRLRNQEEAEETGIMEYLYSGSYCFIEWPDLILPLLDEPYVTVKIETDENESRKIAIDKIRP